MEEIITQFSSIGIAGIIAGVLFKKFLNDSESDKAYFRAEIKDMREEAKKDREMFQAEMDKSREAFLESIAKIIQKIEGLEEEFRELKDDLTKREG